MSHSRPVSPTMLRPFVLGACTYKGFTISEMNEINKMYLEQGTMVNQVPIAKIGSVEKKYC